jgi:hypothetical protein
MTAKHSDLPWTWHGLEEADEFDKRILDMRETDSAHTTLEGPTRSVLIPWDYEGYSCGIYIREADARLIVQAVNSHHELLAACEHMSETLNGLECSEIEYSAVMTLATAGKLINNAIARVNAERAAE